VQLEAPDRQALLVDWLNELLFHTETLRQPFTSFRFLSLTDRALTADIAGPHAVQERTPVKAATHHGLDIVEQGGVLRASVVLDV
jgi:SHS2 domain-containing protein